MPEESKERPGHALSFKDCSENGGEANAEEPCTPSNKNINKNIS